VVALNGSRSAAHVRLILEELFLFQLGLAWRRSGRLGQRKGRAFETGERVRDAVRRVIPFRLTGAQRRALREIVDDMRSRHPMHRLLQGDVGSGKTVVALLAAVFAMESGYQAAFMAPTEILADQHFLTFRRLLGSSYPVGLLTAAGRGAERAAVLAGVADGRTRMVVGTQALIQEEHSVQTSRARRDRRAAPVRRSPARRPDSQGVRRRRPRHDRNPHPADPRPDGVTETSTSA